MLGNILKSILEERSNSPYLNEFIGICAKISLTTFNISKFKELIITKTGLSPVDFAYDAIADLFKQTDGGYLYIENYFKDCCESNFDEDIIKAKLNALIISRTSQRISEIRTDFGENYFKIKKAVQVHLSRNPNKFKSIIFNENVLYFAGSEKQINMDKIFIPTENILDYLYSIKRKQHLITTTVDSAFNYLNEQKDFCKAIININLFNIITEFFKKRYNDFLQSKETVDYINYREQDI